MADDETKSDPTADDLPADLPPEKLRAIILRQRDEIEELRGRMEVIEDALQAVGIFVDEGLEDADPPGTFRAQQLEILVEMMKLHPDYFDLEVVLTQDNIDAILSRWAVAYTQEHGGELFENAEMIKESVWNQPNPYRLLYEGIKGEIEGHDPAEEAGRTEH